MGQGDPGGQDQADGGLIRAESIVYISALCEALAFPRKVLHALHDVQQGVQQRGGAPQQGVQQRGGAHSALATM
jgi:hypothetical protein